MAILLDDSFATAPIAEAVRANLFAASPDFTLVAGLSAANIAGDDVALVSAGEIGHLLASHAVSSQLAVVFDRTAPVALRTPVRPDGIERTPIQLIDVPSSGELLARATLDPFFGITPAGFYRQPVDDAQAVVVGGAMALTPPESGFSEDLGRAWFILTEAAFVSHVLVVPKSEPDKSTDTIEALKSSAESSRRAIRTRIAEASGLDRDVLLEIYQQTRFTLAETDRRALLLLLQLGNRLGEVGPYVSSVEYV